jgi:rubrerythrin
MMIGITFVERQMVSLGLMEKELYQLYTNLSSKVEDLPAKTLFAYIASDSLKHSTVLVKILEEAGGSKLKEQDCDENIRYHIDLVKSLSSDISRTKTVGREELLSILDTLANFETLLFDEYAKAFRVDTTELTEENEDPDKNEQELSVFSLIVKDEDLHKQILLSLVNMCDKKLDFKDNTPIVKYQRPDSWYVPPR